MSGREGRLREKRGSKMRGVGVPRAHRAGGLGDARRTIFPYSRLFGVLIENRKRVSSTHRSEDRDGLVAAEVRAVGGLVEG